MTESLTNADVQAVGGPGISAPNVLVVLPGNNLQNGSMTTHQLDVVIEYNVGYEMKTFEKLTLPCTCEHYLIWSYIISSSEQLANFNKSISQAVDIELKWRVDSWLLLIHTPVTDQEHALSTAESILSVKKFTELYKVFCMIVKENTKELRKKIMKLRKKLNVKICVNYLNNCDNNMHLVCMKCQSDIVGSYLDDLWSPDVTRNKTVGTVTRERPPMIGAEARPNMYYIEKSAVHHLSNSPEIISEPLHSKSLCHPNNIEKAFSDSGDESEISDRTQAGKSSTTLDIKSEHEICSSYMLDNATLISYLNRKNLLQEICIKCKVRMEIDEVQAMITICGWNKQVEKGIEEIRNLQKILFVDSLQFYSLEAKKYFMSDFGKKYLADVCEEHDVSIDVTQEHERTHPISWTFINGKSVILAKGSIVNTSASVGLVPIHTPKYASFTGHLKEVANKPWSDGKQDEIKSLSTTLRKVFEKVGQDKELSVAISLDIHQDWPISVYFPLLFKLCIKALKADVTYPREITFCAVTEGQFKCALQHLDMQLDIQDIECTELCRKDIFCVKEIPVEIVQGELDKVEADVIVNTTSTDLDLSHGSVSAAILKTGGQELQAECREKYPSGLHHAHIAITKGQKLNCSSVYHVSLQHYSPDTALQCLEYVRYLVWTCLQMATEHHVKSIAFPAMGTGMLKYPPNLVASAMFTAVTKFRDACPATLLEEIFFVIYPKNQPVFKAFSEVQNNIVHLENKSRHRTRNMVAINVAGTKQAVDCVKEELIKKLLRVPVDFDVIIEEEIPGVLEPEYCAMLNFCFPELKQVSKCVDFKYCNNNRIILKGEFADVEDAVSKVKQCIYKMRSMPVKKLDVTRGLDTNFVKEIIQTVEKQYEDILCYFDDRNLLITVYGKLEFNVHQVYKKFCSLLLPCINPSKDIVHPLDSQPRMSDVEDKGMSVDDAMNRDSLAVCGSNQITSNVAMQKEIGRSVSVLDKGYVLGHGEYTEGKSTNGNTKNEQEKCAICLDPITKSKQLKCGHSFCMDCIDEYFKIKQVCPTCGAVCGVIVGDQPDGEMTINKINLTLAGYSGLQTLSVAYMFLAGHQTDKHPTPGAWYDGICRVAYFPDNDEGRKICVMLKTAFERRLVFTIGTSRTTGQQGVITWNDIHHKTNYKPNGQFGYPDPTYLERIKDELAAKGVTEEDLDIDLYQELGKPVGVCKVTVVTNR